MDRACVRAGMHVYVYVNKLTLTCTYMYKRSYIICFIHILHAFVLFMHEHSTHAHIHVHPPTMGPTQTTHKHACTLGHFHSTDCATKGILYLSPIVNSVDIQSTYHGHTNSLPLHQWPDSYVGPMYNDIRLCRLVDSNPFCLISALTMSNRLFFFCIPICIYSLLFSSHRHLRNHPPFSSHSHAISISFVALQLFRILSCKLPMSRGKL